MKKIRIALSILLCVLTALCVMSVGAFAADATATTATTTAKDTTFETSESGVVVGTVNLINVSKNQHGPGIEWHNPSDTLTLTNMTIDTADNYGLRLPDGATIVLEGNNTIRASKVALSTEGNLTVKGKGKLTLISDDIGILVSTLNNNNRLTVVGGDITINSVGVGIYCENAIVNQSDKANIEIKTTDGAYAIDARQIKLLGGKFASNASLLGEDIKLMTVNLNITSDKAAFIIDGATSYEKVSIKDVKMKGGADGSSLSDIDVYNGENSISTKAKKVNTKTSAFLELFGVKIPGSNWLDFALIGLVILIVAAFIAIPYIKNYREKDKIASKIAKAREEEKQNMKQSKSQDKD